MTENLQADPIVTIDNSTENTEVKQIEEVKTDEVKPETKEEPKEDDGAAPEEKTEDK